MENKTTQGTKTNNLRVLESHREDLKKRYESLLKEIEVTKEISVLYDVIKEKEKVLSDISKQVMVKMGVDEKPRRTLSSEESLQQYRDAMLEIFGLI